MDKSLKELRKEAKDRGLKRVFNIEQRSINPTFTW